MNIDSKVIEAELSKHLPGATVEFCPDEDTWYIHCPTDYEAYTCGVLQAYCKSRFLAYDRYEAGLWTVSVIPLTQYIGMFRRDLFSYDEEHMRVIPYSEADMDRVRGIVDVVATHYGLIYIEDGNTFLLGAED